MARVWLEFDPEQDEDALWMAQNGLKFWSALRDIDQECRDEVKHGEMSVSSLNKLIGRIRSICGSTEPS